MTLSVQLRHAVGRFALDIAFEAPQGVTVLFGRSGAGKTTIINAIAGLLRPRSGRVTIGDQVFVDTDRGIWLPPHRRRLGYIFQEGRLFPHMSVRANLFYGSWFAGRTERRDDPDAVIDMLGIGHLLDRRPAMLSGGEKQRVAIGRALLASPQIILADEPLASLDDARKAEILPYFERLRDEVSIPVLYVSHAAAEVARLATTVVAIQDGSVVRQGPAASVLGDPMIAPVGVRGVGAMLEASVVRHHADGLTELDAGGERLLLPTIMRTPGSRVRVHVPAHEVLLASQRPDHLSALNILPGTVASIRPGEGPGAIVSVQTRAGIILSRITRRSTAALGLAVGAECHVVIKSVAIAPEGIGGPIPAGTVDSGPVDS